MSETKETGRRLVRVRRSAHLHYPDGFGSGNDKYRGGQGYVVDLDAPLAEEWLKGQEFKVEPVPADELAAAVVGEITNPTAIARLREHASAQKRQRATQTTGQAIKANEAQAAKTTSAAPPAPDPEEPPAESGSVAEVAPPAPDGEAPGKAKGKKGKG